jgi:hypothetical protein
MNPKIEIPQFIPCAFVNQEEIIKYGDFVGYKVTENQTVADELTLTIIQEVFYKHPDAPNHALLSVYQPFTTLRARKGDRFYPQLLSLLLAQQIINQIPNNQTIK